MIVVTSLSPNHSNADMQQAAIHSWQSLGECYSLNVRKEIDKLEKQGYVGIKLVETKDTMYSFIGKHLVKINAVIGLAKEKKESLLLINSDIVLRNIPALKEDGVTIFSRYDFTNSYSNCTKFQNGFDVFYIPKKFLEIFPTAIYSLGAPWHDYFSSLYCLLNNVPLYYPDGKFAFHKTHTMQYSFEEWTRIGQHFKKDFGFKDHLSIGEVAAFTLKKINDNLIRY